MSDIFENDIDSQDEDFSAFEDDESEISEDDGNKVVYFDGLYKLRLAYSCEGLYATAKGIRELSAGDYVVVPTRYGKDLALVLGRSKHPVGLRQNDIIAVDRKADDDDIARYHEYERREQEAFTIFKEKVRLHDLDMKLVAVHFMFEEQKALFFFSSDNRVDFRELVKDLVAVFKMRIELRQIGVRDESRIIGGLGVCGRAFCCNSITDRLPPVSIKMAKEQDLSLNSTKISGQCGRLLCCLSYEYHWYAEARRSLPNEGIHIHYDDTNFRITDVNPLSKMIKMLGEDGRLLEVAASRFVKESGRWKII